MRLFKLQEWFSPFRCIHVEKIFFFFLLLALEFPRPHTLANRRLLVLVRGSKKKTDTPRSFMDLTLPAQTAAGRRQDPPTARRQRFDAARPAQLALRSEPLSGGAARPERRPAKGRRRRRPERQAPARDGGARTRPVAADRQPAALPVLSVSQLVANAVAALPRRRRRRRRSAPAVGSAQDHARRRPRSAARTARRRQVDADPPRGEVRLHRH